MKTTLTILEIVNTDRLRVYRNEYFPFIQALANERGVRCTFLSIGVEAQTAASGGNLYLYDLEDRDLQSIGTALAEAAPTHVLLNERLTPKAFEHLRGAAPAASFKMLQMLPSGKLVELLETWLGLDLSDLREDGRLVEEAVRPDFRKTRLNNLAREIRPYPSLLVGPSCDYVRPLREHSDFHGLDHEALNHRGCAFCVNPDPRQFLPSRDPVHLAMEQLAAAAETMDPAWQDRSFLVRGVNLLPRVEELAAALDAAATPPTTFFISTRIDRVLRLEEPLRRALPVLARGGHVLHVWNMGIENYSPRENRRFNKGLDPEVITAGAQVIDALRRDHADAFHFDGFGYILYTPWTRPEDLRKNLEALSSPGSTDGGFALGTALQLLPGLPITRLAEADGLVVEAFEDQPTDSGCITTWDGVEVPWRFADPRSARMYLLTRRLHPRGIIPEDDPLLGQVRAWLETLPERARDDLVTTATALLDVLGGAGALPSVEDHLQAAGDLLVLRFPDSAPPVGQKVEGAPEQVALLERLRGEADALPIVPLRVVELRLRPDENGGRIELALEGGPTRLDIMLERSDEAAPAFLRAGPLALSYKSRTPGPTEEEIAALRALIGYLSRTASP